MVVSLDAIQTLGIAVLVLYAGMLLKKRISFFEKFCIPIPVIGGILFSLLTLVGYETGVFQFSFDMILKDMFMIAFFTTIGFNASLKPLKEGGKRLIVLAVLVVLLCNLQNIAAVLTAPLVGVEKLMALCTGSIPMIGGHGSAGAYGPLLKAAGIDGATSIAMAAATFGLVAGSFMGGPLGKHLITKYNLITDVADREKKEERGIFHNIRAIMPGKLCNATYQLVFAMGAGTILTYFISKAGLQFPAYFGAMLAGAIIRNIADYSKKFETYTFELNEIGELCLSFFLAMALMELRLWELAALALPLMTLLLVQVILMFVFARFAVFPLLGKDYDAAVITAGVCGFGMGATPNAMANMKALTDKYVMSPVAFLVVPVLGSFFNDLINGTTILAFISLLK